MKNTLAASGRWFTDAREEVEWYLAHEYFDHGEIVALSMPASEAEKYRVSNIPLKPGGKDAPENPRAFSRRPEKEFFLPAEVAARAVPLPAAANEEVMVSVLPPDRGEQLRERLAGVQRPIPECRLGI